MVIKDRLRWDSRAAMIAGLVALMLLAVWMVLVAGAGLEPVAAGPDLAIADLPEPRLPTAPEPAPRPYPLPRPIG